MYFKVLTLLCCAIFITNASTLQGTIDVNRLQGILQDSLKSKDLPSLYYAIKGLSQLNAKIPDVCEAIKNSNYDIKNVEHVFYLTNAVALMKCSFLKPDVMNTPVQILEKKDATIPELYYAVYAMKALGKGTVYDKEDALKNLVTLLKKDDSPANYGFVFALCEHMGCGTWTTQHTEGVLLSADESDNKALHFEGGLPATASLLGAISRTYKALKKPSPLTPEQRNKFAEYLLSRKSVSTPKGAALLLEAARAIADEEPTPIAISIKGKKYITAESDSIEITVSDLIGRPLKNLKADDVIAQSGTRLSDDVVVLSKQPLTQKANEPTTFVLNLSKIKSQYGVYKIALSAGLKTASVNVAVLGEIQVSTVEIGVGDVDGTTSPKTTVVNYPNKLTEKLQADHMQKLTVKFQVRDKSNKPVSVQQAFVHIASLTGDAETIFIAESDNTKTYKVEMNVKAISRAVGGTSGAYSVSVMVGDSAAAAPRLWMLGAVEFSFAQADKVPPAAERGPRPVIAYQFRAASPRPARLLSDVAAGACAAPLVLLLVLWGRLGPRLELPRAPAAAVLFHVALAGSLGLYAVFWVKLTMFETVRYLLPLALVTFLSGHRLLRRQVRDKLAK